MDKLEHWVRIRIRLVGCCFALVFALVVVRAFQLQVVGQEQWEKRAERQHQKIVPLTAQRGTVYDRNGEELALSVELDSIFVEPQKAAEALPGSRALAQALSLPPATVKDKLESKKSFLWLKRQVSPKESAQVRALNLPGIGSIKEPHRFYPNSAIAAQVIGFTGLDPEGLEGLELKYDSMLLGQGGYLVTERDALGRGIGAGEVTVEGASPGNNLVLTLDKQLQYIAEKELAAGVAKTGAKAGSVVVLDPQTGAVLAMASQPDYNPNAISRHRPSQWRNRAVGDTFEPGSTFKIFLLAAALNEKLITPRQLIDCGNGSYRVGGKVIHDHRAYGRISAAEILKVSSNIGVAKIGKSLERERFHRYLADFGFGMPTGVDLPGESGGVLRRPAQWFEVDLAAIAFGQGLTVTPLQLATAVGAIANGGKLMQPFVVSRVVDGFGEEVEHHGPRLVRQVVSPETAAQVREMMVAVTETGGTGTLAAVPGFRVAGKTGTAQKVDPVTGGYSADKRVASFVGFVPAEAPRLVILALVDEPVGEVYGGLVAAPIFSGIAAQSLQYLQVAPTLPAPEQNLLPAQWVQAPGQATVPEDEVGAIIDGAPLMPNYFGFSGRQVLQAMGRSGLNIRLIGSGRVVEQAPSAGQPIPYGSEVWVRLAPPS